MTTGYAAGAFDPVQAHSELVLPLDGGSQLATVGGPPADTAAVVGAVLESSGISKEKDDVPLPVLSLSAFITPWKPKASWSNPDCERRSEKLPKDETVDLLVFDKSPMVIIRWAGHLIYHK